MKLDLKFPVSKQAAGTARSAVEGLPHPPDLV